MTLMRKKETKGFTHRHSHTWTPIVEEMRSKAQNLHFKKTNIYSCACFRYEIFALEIFKSNHTILPSNSMNSECVYLHGKCDSCSQQS